MLKLEFATDNDTFGEDDERRRAEVHRIMCDLAARIGNGSEEGGGVYDVNGNRVGQWSLTA